MEEINKEIQEKALILIRDTFSNYEELTREWRWRMFDIYKAYSIFKWTKRADWSSTFKINKAFEITNKNTSKIFSKNPKWIVSIRKDSYNYEVLTKEWPDKIAETYKIARAIQDYLNMILDNEYQFIKLKSWCKAGSSYWLSHSKIEYKYEVNEKWVYKEAPTIEIISWTDLYFDPRYKTLKDLPCIIEIKRRVRLSSLQRNVDKYFNLDILSYFPKYSEFTTDPDWYKSKVMSLTWLSDINLTNWVDLNSLDLKIYYWYFNTTDDILNEKMYKITTVNDILVIGFEEIRYMPFEVFKVFEDLETYYAVWFIEPMLSLQDELNFKKNSGSEYINHALNRSWLWSPNSWVNPKDLISKPNGIIVASNGVQVALENLQELPHRPLTQDFFSEGNDFERQIQELSFSVNTSQPRSDNALTNTATGARINFYESNTVLDDIRRSFELSMSQLAYKLLECVYDNLENNICIGKIWEEWFWQINKEAFRNAMDKYIIKVEANSSSYDSIENRRNDSLAKWNILVQAKNLWVDVDLKKWIEDLFSTFEDNNPSEYINTPNPSQLQEQQQQIAMQQWQWQWQSWVPWVHWSSTMPKIPWTPWQWNATQLTQQVARWNITGWF